MVHQPGWPVMPLAMLANLSTGSTGDAVSKSGSFGIVYPSKYISLSAANGIHHTDFCVLFNFDKVKSEYGKVVFVIEHYPYSYKFINRL